MKMHSDWVFSITLAYMAAAAYLLWLVHQGMDPTLAVAAGLATVAITGATILLSLSKWESKRAQQLEESRRGFPWRRFASGNALGVGFVAIFAASGTGMAELKLDAALIFGIANAGAIVQWLMQRRAAGRAPQDGGNTTD
jgi:uncharacterized membrane protein (DUF4010 family)